MELSKVSSVELLKEVFKRMSTGKIGFDQVMDKPDDKELEKCHIDIRKVLNYYLILF